MLSIGAKTVYAGKLNQDPLEQEFGKHRSLCGSNTNPTVAQYGQSVGKIRMLKGVMPEILGGNTSVVNMFLFIFIRKIIFKIAQV